MGIASGGGVALVVKILGDTSGLNSSMDSATKSVKGFGGAIGGIPIGTLALGAGAATAVAAGLWEVGKAGANAAAEEKAYAKAIEQAGAATGNWVQQSDAAIAAGQKLAFTDSETMEAMTALTTATHDVAKSTDLLTGAQDIARLAGVDLATASDAVAKAYNGNDRALKALVPGLKAGANGYETIQNASRAAKGQAEAFAESGDAASMMLTDSFGELVEEVGKALLPAFKALMPGIQAIIKVMTTLIKAILPVLTPMVELLAKGLEFAAKVLEKVADAIAWVIDQIKKLLAPLGDAIDALGSIKLPFGIGGASVSGMHTQAMGRSVNAQSGGTVAAPFTVNIYGDPAVIETRVTKALRDYMRRNGTVSLLSPSRL